MKSNIKFIISTLVLVIGFNAANAQEKLPKIRTVEFKVDGVCEMCKNRIQSSALIKGVKLAQWNKESKQLKVIYSTKNATEEAIHKAIAEAGHDTEKMKAKDENYNALPGCCLYRDGLETH